MPSDPQEVYAVLHSYVQDGSKDHMKVQDRTFVRVWWLLMGIGIFAPGFSMRSEWWAAPTWGIACMFWGFIFAVIWRRREWVSEETLREVPSPTLFSRPREGYAACPSDKPKDPPQIPESIRQPITRIYGQPFVDMWGREWRSVEDYREYLDLRSQMVEDPFVGWWNKRDRNSIDRNNPPALREIKK